MRLRLLSGLALCLGGVFSCQRAPAQNQASRPPQRAPSVAETIPLVFPVPPACNGERGLWSDDASKLLFVCENIAKPRDEDSIIELRDGATGIVTAQRANAGDCSTSLIDATATYIVCTSREGLEVRNGDDLSLKTLVIVPPKSRVTGFAMSADSRKLAIGYGPQGANPVLVELAVDTSQVLSRVEIDESDRAPHYVGDTVVVGGKAPGVNRAFAGGKETYPAWLEHRGNHTVNSDGTRLAIGEQGRVLLWDVKTDRRTGVIDGWDAYGLRWVGPFLGNRSSSKLVLRSPDSPSKMLELDIQSDNYAVTPDGRHVREASPERLTEWTLTETAKRSTTESPRDSSPALELRSEQPRILKTPRFPGPRVLGFRRGILFVHIATNHALAQWQPGSLLANVASVGGSRVMSLSPDGKVAIIDGYPRSAIDTTTGKPIEPRATSFWSVNGQSSITADGKWLSPNKAERSLALRDETVPFAFAGNEQELLATERGHIVLINLDKPKVSRQLVPEEGRNALSEDQKTLAVVTDHRRTLTVLRAPTWAPLSKTITINGMQQLALSADGTQLALLDEYNQLELRDVAKLDAPPRPFRLPAAPAITTLHFDPTSRFLVAGGMPIQFIRISDGKVLALYLGDLDGHERHQLPMLFVSDNGDMEGDTQMADEHFHGMRPSSAPRRSQVVAGLIQRFFAP